MQVWLVVMMIMTSSTNVMTSSCQEQRRQEAAYETDAYMRTYTSADTAGAMLDDWISNVRGKFNCNGESCHECLNSSNVLHIVNIATSDQLTNVEIQSASLVMLLFIIEGEHLCNDTSVMNSTIQEIQSYFIERLFDHHDHEDDHEEHDLENEVLDDEHEGDHEEHDHENEVLDDEHEDDEEHHEEHEAISLTELQELMELLNETLIIPQHVQGNCNQTYSADAIYAIYYDTDTSGVDVHDLGEVASYILSRVIKGDCITFDQSFPEKGDFAVSVFEEFATQDRCAIDYAGLERFASTLGIGIQHDHDDHDDYDEEDHTIHDHRQRKRASDEHIHQEESTNPLIITECMSVEELMRAYSIHSEQGVTIQDFPDLSVAFLQQAIQGCVVEAHTEEIPDTNKLTQAQVYGYGFLSVFVISIISILGLLVFPWRHHSAFLYVLACMLGLAVGSLTGDAMLHLIPQAVGLHDHGGSDSHDHSGEGIVIEPYLWKMTCVCVSVWAFYMLQLALSALQQKVAFKPAKVVDKTGVTDVVACGDGFEILDKKCSISDVDIRVNDFHNHCHDAMEQRPQGEEKGVYWSLPLMVLIGDGVHNFADGLAIGAAFMGGWRAGLSTSLAVMIHEIPHEFGDIAILLQSGWGAGRTALFQLLSAATAFVGLFVGINIASIEGAQEWVFVLAAGMFLYVALGDVVPELQSLFRTQSKWKIFLASNLGIFVGYLALLLIAIYEEKINI